MGNEEKLGKLPNPMRKAFEKIIGRCEKAGVEYALTDTGFFEEHDLIVRIQQGTTKREIRLSDVDEALRLLDSDFERYVFVEGYEAICCYEEGCVEGVIGPIGQLANKAVILGRLVGRRYGEEVRRIKDGVDDRLELVEGGDKGVRISVGNPSNTLLGMVNSLEVSEDLSVRVEGLKISKNMEAGEELGRVTNSLFFELRGKRNINLFVKRRYEVETSELGRKWRITRLRRGRESEVSFPKFEYDTQPIELYWHAVSAYKMPLLQYLAYYQILEYYFKKYSMLGAKKEISNCLKDPEFNADDDNDIVRIVTCVTGKLGPYIREEDILRDTIRECVSKDELKLELTSGPFKEYFRKEYKIVSQFKVSQENSAVDIRDQLSERIYDIRCRIVHKKEGDGRGRIMPFTKEEVLLREYDLPLVEAVAKKVLIANSKKLSFR